MGQSRMDYVENARIAGFGRFRIMLSEVLPNVRNRGARRIVCGGRQPMQPVACYYTADHYASFRRIVP